MPSPARTQRKRQDDHNPVARSLAHIASLAGSRRPLIGVVLGSGWHDVADRVQDAVDIAYGDLPAFPVVGVTGHAGMLRLGKIDGVEVAVLSGRQHTYETGQADAMKGAIRTLARLGVRLLLLTNAAGSLDTAMRPGSMMVLSDHLNMVQRTPLQGDGGNERFVDLRGAYDPTVRATALRVAAENGVALHEGVYAWMIGPQFETPAEIRMLRLLGAQAVGMSTVPETIIARHAGLRVLALSMFTNMGCGIEDEALSHGHTLAVAQQAGAGAARFVEALLPALAKQL
jgi:purine-nucleoside phosphorylase